MEFSINPLDLVKQLRLLQALLPGMGEDIMAVYTNYKKNEYKKMQHVWKASEFRNLYKDRRGKYVEPIRWTYDLMKRYEDYLKNYLSGVQRDLAAELLGLRPSGFRPQHSSKLGNEFRLFTSYDPGARLGGWGKEL